MFLKFDGELSNDKFISIVIASFTRAHHVKALVDSIHQHADMPFEIIVIDDCSQVCNDTQTVLFNELRSKVSTLILTCGMNMGLASTFNRGIALANGDIVLIMNDDTRMVGPAFRMIQTVLRNPYIGVFGPLSGTHSQSDDTDLGHVQLVSGGVNFHTAGVPGTGSIFAFRKQLWMEIGGCPQIYHNGSDLAFFFRLNQLGYFTTEFPVDKAPVFANVDRDNGFPEATAGRTRFDSSYPQVFGVADLEQKTLLRKERMYNYSSNQYKMEAGLHNADWWQKYFLNARSGDSYDWELMKRFGHDKWRDLFEKDVAGRRG